MEQGLGWRQARLAAWGTAWLRRRCDLATALDAVVGDDAVHTVVDVPGEPQPLPLGPALEAFQRLGVTGLRYLPAAPGDASALPGPAEFNARAVAAGGGVVTLGAVALGLLPDVERHGPADDTVWSVRWLVQPVGDRLLPPVDLRNARRRLAEELHACLEHLQRLDVTRDSGEATALARGWSRESRGCRLPPGSPPEAADLLLRATHLREAVALGLRDDGGAVSGWEAQQRRQALASLDGALRQVAADAWNAGLAPDADAAPVA